MCHSDPDLVRSLGGQTVSLYVNTEVLEASAHKGVPCTGCHIDFAYKTPHSNVTLTGDEWSAVAKSACKNCHPQAFADYTSSAHSPSEQAGRVDGHDRRAGLHGAGHAQAAVRRLSRRT